MKVSTLKERSLNLLLSYEIELDIPDSDEVILKVCEACVEDVKSPFVCAVGVTVTDEESMRGLNLKSRGFDSATDVLSFPLLEFPSPADFSEIRKNDWGIFDPDTESLMLGDIVLCADRIYSQAREYGHSLKRELAFLLAHSMYHLFGYDHKTDSDRQIMENKQRELLKRLEINR